MPDRDAIGLPSSGLLSKWGFGDGDMLDDLLWDWAEREGIDAMEVDEHAVLKRLVYDHLLPALDQKVEVYEIVTIHNPIRAAAVDGEEVPDSVIYGDAEEPTLTPSYVSVPLAEVYRVARETLSSRAAEGRDR